MGHYDVVVADDEAAVWKKDEGGKVTHILLVGFIGLLVYILVKAITRKMIGIMLHLQFHHHSIVALLPWALVQDLFHILPQLLQDQSHQVLFLLVTYLSQLLALQNFLKGTRICF